MSQANDYQKPMKPVQKDMQNCVILALGGNQPSNVGPPGKTIRNAVHDLAAAGLKPVSVSQYYRTPCFPPGAGPDFVNAAVLCKSDKSAVAILSILHGIEKTYGRQRRERWGSRTLDIDLLAMDDQILPDLDTYRVWFDLAPSRQQADTPKQLILPHPRLQDRGFVLIPMADVAPGWRHPVLGLTVSEMLAKLPETAKAGVVPISGF